MLRGVDKQFQDRGLTVSKWRILAVLSDRGTCRFGELARLTSIEPATLSRFVSALIREGLIRRRRSSSDARAVTIGLTERGEQAFTGTLPWALEVENTLVSQIDVEDVAKLKQMLKQMYANIHQEFGESEDDEQSIAADPRVSDA
jgi:DNA-binding MarR family transcriptional regulator